MTRSQQPPGCRGTLRLRVPPDLHAVRAAVDEVAVFLREAGCGEPDLMDSRLALGEACNNVVIHGRRTAADDFEINADCDSEQIRLEILDHTQGLDWPADVQLPDPSSETGRGIFLIYAVMDTVDYERNGVANRLRLVKKRTSAAT